MSNKYLHGVDYIKLSGPIQYQYLARFLKLSLSFFSHLRPTFMLDLLRKVLVPSVADPDGSEHFCRIRTTPIMEELLDPDPYGGRYGSRIRIRIGNGNQWGSTSLLTCTVRV